MSEYVCGMTILWHGMAISIPLRLEILWSNVITEIQQKIQPPGRRHQGELREDWEGGRDLIKMEPLVRTGHCLLLVQ